MGNESSKSDFSDVRGAMTSTAADVPPAAKADFNDVQSHVGSTVDETTIYTVATGDNLSAIAKHFYGNANAWKAIFDTNRDRLSDPDKIKPGQMLKIPAKS